jgi:mRNA deadenylase, exonuclease subunit and related nucleases
MFVKHFSKISPIKIFHDSKKNFHSFSNKWVELPEHSRKPHNDNHIRILSYNILAESNIRTDMYPECTSYDLDWRRRASIVIQ